MKKLMLAVAIVCAAAMAKAGAVNWYVYGVASPNSGMAYLFDSSVDAGDVETALLNGTFIAEYSGLAAYSEAISGGMLELDDILAGEYSGPTTLWMVGIDKVTDTANYFIGEDIKLTIGTAGSKTYEWYNSGDDQNTTGWQSVPEPTSGLLLLLGVAGLALKRKRA